MSTWNNKIIATLITRDGKNYKGAINRDSSNKSFSVIRFTDKEMLTKEFTDTKVSNILPVTKEEYDEWMDNMKGYYNGYEDDFGMKISEEEYKMAVQYWSDFKAILTH